jgi:hypothetical protein
MLKILSLATTLVLACCMTGFAQTSNTSQEQSKPNSSAYSQNESAQNETAPAKLPPSSSAQKITLEGCLSQSTEGSFMLADNASGKSYQLTGETGMLNDFLGKEVRVEGKIMGGAANPAAMSSKESGGMATPAPQVSVSKVRKVSNTCKTGAGAKTKY